MRLFAIVLMLSITGALFFGANKVYAAEENKGNDKPKIVTVEKGDTLSKLADENDTTYKRLFNANKSIEHPDLIYPGDKLRVPEKDEKLKSRLIGDLAGQNTVYHTQNLSKGTNPGRAVSSGNYSGGVWDKLAACESGGNWSINTGNGYYGGLQFNVGTWRANGGSGYPHQASKAEQIRVAKNLHASRGFSPWPGCSSKLGL